MLAFALRRLAGAAAVVVLVAVALTVVSLFLPGDPARQILGPRASPELIAQVREELRLDDPVPVQVWDFLSGAVRWDFGNDFVNGVAVSSLIGDALPHTIVLVAASILLAALVGIPLGVVAAARPGGPLDRLTGLLSISLISVPPYVIAALLLLVFVIELRALPSLGTGSLADPIDYARHLVLPATALAVGWIGYLSRLVRAGMLEALASDYVRTTRAYGLDERTILWRHALRNSITPTIAVLAVGFGSLLSGAVLVEVIFNRPGLGLLLVDSVESRNWAIVRACVFVIALGFVLANLVADLVYRRLDPRVGAGTAH